MSRIAYDVTVAPGATGARTVLVRTRCPSSALWFGCSTTSTGSSHLLLLAMVPSSPWQCVPLADARDGWQGYPGVPGNIAQVLQRPSKGTRLSRYSAGKPMRSIVSRALQSRNSAG